MVSILLTAARTKAHDCWGALKAPVLRASKYLLAAVIVLYALEEAVWGLRKPSVLAVQESKQQQQVGKTRVIADNVEESSASLAKKENVSDVVVVKPNQPVALMETMKIAEAGARHMPIAPPARTVSSNHSTTNPTRTTTTQTSLAITSGSLRTAYLPPPTAMKNQQRHNPDWTFPVTVPSPACRPRLPHNQQIRRLFFAHTRKAGGTFLRHFFGLVSRKYQWELKVVEGRAPFVEDRRADTLYVTNLRHPVDRIVSAYKYEGRWNCRAMVYERKTYFPSHNNSRSFEDFVALKPPKPNNRPCFAKVENAQLWHCADLCYLRLFGDRFNCLPKDKESARYDDERELLRNHAYRAALWNLHHRMDLIVVTERLRRDLTYWRGLLKMFGLLTPENADQPITAQQGKTHALTLPGGRPLRTNLYCEPESQFWNGKYPPILKNQTLQRLYQANALDIELYHNLTDCPDGIVFPHFPLLDLQQHNESMTRHNNSVTGRGWPNRPPGRNQTGP